MMKRNREGVDNANITVMANYLMLLSSSGGRGGRDSSNDRVFTCKTCERQFTSFQALGGHRASHKKPRLIVAGGGVREDHLFQPPPPSPPKPKIHECSVCGLEFPMGQALGGHMRRHRANNSVVDYDGDDDPIKQIQLPQKLLPIVVKKLANNNNNHRRVLCFDLNLTPLENKFVFGRVHVPAAVDFI